MPQRKFDYRIFILFCITCCISVSSFAQVDVSTCPIIEKRSNGNGQANRSPGIFTFNGQNNPVATNVVGTEYQTLSYDPATKTGNINFRWTSATLVEKLPIITRAWLTSSTGNFGSPAPVKFGPPPPPEASGNFYYASYHFYVQNLPPAGKITLEFSDPQQKTPLFRCTFDLQSNATASEPTIDCSPTIITQPVSQNLCGATTATFSVTADGASSTKWQVSNDGSTGWTDITNGGDYSGATTKTLTIQNPANYDGKYYRAVLAATGCSSTNSNAVILSAKPLPTAVFNNSSGLCGTGTRSMAVNFTGTAPWSFTYSTTPSGGGTTSQTVYNITTSTYYFSVTPSTTTTYAITAVSDANCSNASPSGGNLTATISSAPTLTPSSNPITCFGSNQFTLNYTSTGSPNRYSLSAGVRAMPGFSTITNATLSSSPLSVSIPSSGVPAGVYDFNLTVNNSTTGCTSVVIPITVTVAALPSVAATAGSGTVCAGGSVSLLASPSNLTSYSWSSSPSLTIASIANPSVTVGTNASYQFTVTGTDANGCSASASVTVNTTAGPTISITPTSPSICAGNASTLTASGGNTYTWSPSTGLSSTSGATVVASPSTTTVYTVTSANVTGCASVGQVTVTVSTPNITVTASETICAGSIKQLTAAGGASYVWYPATGLYTDAAATVAYVSGSNATTVYAKPSSTTTYYVEGTTAGGCKGVASSTVTISPIPIDAATSASPNFYFCAQGSSSFPISLDIVAGNTVTSATWYASLDGSTFNTFTSGGQVGDATLTTSSSGLNRTLTISGWSGGYDGPVKVRLTFQVSGSSCTYNYDISLFDTKGNTASSLAPSASKTTVCSGESVVLSTGTTSGFTGITWQSSSNNSTWNTISGATSSSYTTPALTSLTYYRFVLAASGSCGYTSASTAITVASALAANTISSSSSCTDGASTITITGSNITGGIYQWQSSTTSSTDGFSDILGATSQNYTLPVTTLSTRTWYRRYASTSSCAATLSTAVQINPPVANNQITNSSTVNCSTAPITVLTGSTPVGGNGSYTYEWQISTNGTDFTAIASSNNINYTTLTQTSDRWYRRVVTGGGCTSTSGIFLIKVNTPATTAVNATSSTICSGSSTTLTASGAVSYTWTPSTGLSATTGASVTANPTSTTTYTVTGTDANACTSSANINITVTAAPTTPTLSSSTRSICSGSSANLSSMITSGAGTYEWYTAPEVNASYAVATPTAISTAGTYYVFAKNGSCYSSYASVSLSVVDVTAPSVSATSLTMCSPQTADLTALQPVAASGVTLQWHTNNTASAQVLTPTSVNSGTYYLFAYSAAGNCYGPASSAVTVTVNTVTNATVSSTSVSVCEPSTVNLNSYNNTSGSGLTFSWHTVSSNPTAANQVFIPTSISSSGTYYLYATSAAGCRGDASSGVAVVVNSKPTAQISSPAALCNNAATTITATSNASSPTYAWQMSTDGGDNWSTVTNTGVYTGATSSSLQISNTTGLGGYFYRYTVTSGAGCSSTSNNAILLVETDPVISTQPANITVSAGVNASFTADANNTPTASYQWQISINNGSTFENITNTSQYGGINSATLIVKSTTSGMSGYQYRCVISSACTSVTSEAKTLTVTACTPPTPTFTTSPSSTVCITANITYTTQSGKDSYVWTVPGTLGVDYTIVSGSLSSTSNTVTLTWLTAGSKTVTVNYSEGGCAGSSAASNTTTVQAALANNVLTAPATLTFCTTGDPAVINGSTPTGGSGSYTYTWESSTTNATSNFTTISGAVSASYDPGSLSSTTWFRRVVSGGACESLTSTTVEITIQSAIANNTISTTGTLTFCDSGDPSNIVGSTPTGGSGAYTYVWESSTTNSTSNFTAISGAISANYDPGTITQTTWFRRIVSSTGACTSLTSTAVEITVQSAIANNTISTTGTLTFCDSGDPSNIVGSTPTGGSGAYTYVWESSTTNSTSNFTAISGATSANYDPGTITQTTWFRRIVSSTGACTSLTSTAVEITVQSAIANTTISTTGTLTFCGSGDPSNIVGSTPTGGSGAYTYVWESSTTNSTSNFTAISGATSASYDPGTITQTTWFRRIVSSTGACTSLTSTAVEITVLSAIANNTISTTGTLTFCGSGDPSNIVGSTPTGGSGAYTYVWESSTTNSTSNFTAISGATSANYDPGTITQTTWFRRIVFSTGACTSLTSTAVEITVQSAIANNTISTTGTLTFCGSGDPSNIVGSTPTGGSGAYTYVWESSTTNSTSNFTAISGAISANYDPGTITQTTWFRRIVSSTGACTSLTSTAVEITVQSAIANNTISTTGTLTFCGSGDPSNIVGSTPTGGSGAYTYVWESSTTNSTSNFTAISGATSANYDPGTITQTTWFRRIVSSTGACTSLTSTAVEITVQSAIANNTISTTGTLTFCGSGDPSNIVGSTPTGGSGAYTYVWESSTTNSTSNFTAISGATSANYDPGTITQTTWFKRQVTGGSCTTPAVTNVIQFEVKPIAVAADITVSNVSQCINLTATLTASSAGITSPVYKWYADASLSNLLHTGTTYTTQTLSATTSYYITVSGVEKCENISTTAKQVTVTVLTPTLSGTITSVSPVCTGINNSTLTLSGHVGNILKWQSASLADFSTGVTDIAQTSNAITVNNLTATTYYRAVVQNNGCAIENSASVGVTVNAVPSINITPSTVTLNKGGSITLTASGASTYSWSPAATLSSAVTASVVATPTATTVYTVTGTSITGCVAATTLTVTVQSLLNPDFGITHVNVALGGNVSTNDNATTGSTYGNPSALSGNPGTAVIVMNANGTYTFTASVAGKYRYYVPVCNAGQTTGCSLTLLQITVLDPALNTNPPIANPDIAVTRGTTPVTINLVNNDKCSNTGCSLNLTSLSIVTQPANGGLVVNADGTIVYTANNSFTGKDSLIYSICDNGIPVQCATTVVYITVEPSVAGAITTATDDYAYTRVGLAVSGNILTNDNYSGSGATLVVTANETPSSTKGVLVVNSNGTYTFTPAVGFSGPLDITYTVCAGTPTSCANATLHILVSPFPIDAVNDNFSSQPIDGAKGGVSRSVLTNDKLNNNTVLASQVNLTILNNGGLTGLVFNDSAALVISSKTTEGTYTVTYKICDKSNPNSCDSATVTLVVARGLFITASAVCINDVPYINYKIEPNFIPASSNPATFTWLNGDKTVLSAQTIATGQALEARMLWPGAVLDNAGNPIDWPGWFIQNGEWVQGADGFEKTRPTAYLVISVNPTDTIALSYPPATPACAASPEKFVLKPGAILDNQTICIGTVPAALSSKDTASGGVGAISYQWQQSADSVNFTNIINANSKDYIPGVLNTNMFYRRLAKTAIGQQIASNIVKVSVKNKPVVTSISGPCAIPKDSSFVFTANSSSSVTRYQWTLPNGWAGASTRNTILATASNLGGIVKVKAYDSTCAGDSATYVVSVIDYAKVTITGVPVQASGNNNSAIKVTIQLYDALGNKINCSGGVATLCSDYGTFSPVIDHKDGTYSADLTASANNINVCGTVGGIPIVQKITVTFTGPQGSLSANKPMLATEIPQLTFTPTAGREPFIVIYRSEKSTKDDTLTNVRGGQAVNVASIPSTTLYRLISVIDANGERRDNNFIRDTATVVVLAPKVVITLKADPPKLAPDSSYATRLVVKTKNIGDLDLQNSQAKLNLRQIFPAPVTYVLDSVIVSGRTVVPNKKYNGEIESDLFARKNKPVKGSDAHERLKNLFAYQSTEDQKMYSLLPDGSAGFSFSYTEDADNEFSEQIELLEQEGAAYLFGPLSSLPIGEEATILLYLHIKPNGYKEPFVMQATAEGVGVTDRSSATTTSVSNDNDDIGAHPEVTQKGNPVPTVLNLFPNATVGIALAAGTPVQQSNGSFNVPMTIRVKNHGNVNLQSVQVNQHLLSMITNPSVFQVQGAITATGTLIANAGFNGKTDLQLLAPNSQLGIGQEYQITYTINIVPNQFNVLYQLHAYASGFSQDLNIIVKDTSTNGLNTDPDNNNIPSEKIVTEIIINIPVPPLVPGNIGIDLGNGNTTDVSAHCGSSGIITVIPVSTTTGGLSTYTYQWQKSVDNVRFYDILGAVGANYTQPESTESYYLRRGVISGSLIQYSNSVFIKVSAVVKPVITNGGSLTLTHGGYVTLSASNGSQYQWSNGSSSKTVTITTPGKYRVTVTSVEGCAATSDDVIVIPPPPIVTDKIYVIGGVGNPPTSVNQVSPSTGAILNFYILSTGGTLIPVPSLPANPGQFTYYVSQTINGIESAIVPYKVTMVMPLTLVDVEKLVSQKPVLQGDGTFKIGFKIYITNKSAVLLDSMSLVDDLTKTFPLPVRFQVSSIKASGNLIANPQYNGTTRTDLLIYASSVAAGKKDSIEMEVIVTPNGYNGILNNTAILTGRTPYGVLSVVSNDPTISNGIATRAPARFEIPKVEIFIPSGFSPNRDGTNDRFVITRPFNTTISLEIYNRWGNAVYRAQDYNNEWDGRGNIQGRLGDELPDGTYFYIVLATDKLTGTVQKFNGYLILKR